MKWTGTCVADSPAFYLDRSPRHRYLESPSLMCKRFDEPRARPQHVKAFRSAQPDRKAAFLQALAADEEALRAAGAATKSKPEGNEQIQGVA